MNELFSPAGFDDDVWPALPQAAWSGSCATLQLWTQIVGKVRLALTPAINHTWNVPLYRKRQRKPSVPGMNLVVKWGSE